MAINIVNQNPDTLETFKSLGIKKPELAAFLPCNLSDVPPDEFLYPAETKTLRKLLSDTEFPHFLLDTDEISPAFFYLKSADWVGPTLFIAYALSDSSVAIYLNVLSSYLYDLFRNRSKTSKVKLEVITETTPDTESKRITYCGDVSGIAEIRKIIRDLKK